MAYILNYAATEIHKNLWQGAAPPWGTDLKRLGVDVLVLAAAENQASEQYPNVKVICCPGDDDECPNRLSSFIPGWLKAGELAARHVKAGQIILITCMAGLNRSGFIAAVTLHHLTGFSGEKCVRHIQARRTGALNNLTFVEFLVNNI